MRKTDYISIGVLMLVPFLIFYALFGSEYLYTDEAVQLWLYRKGSGYQMFTSQGRYVTEKIFQALFSSITTIGEVTYLRLFSFFGWVISIPVWYVVLKKVLDREGLPRIFAFFSVLYLITMPPFSVYVSWASCMELFLANTSALLSGYALYSAVEDKGGALNIRAGRVALSLLLGLLSLFTYQTGFGCFLLPFLLNLIAVKKPSRLFWTGVAGCFVVYFLYFLLFKLSVFTGWAQASDRTGLYLNPLRKLLFLLTRPLSGSFHFTLLFNERSSAGVAVYLLIAGAWLLTSYRLLRGRTLAERLVYYGAVFLVLLCCYIPGLIVKENYASNRTLFALNLAVFFLVMDTLLRLVVTAHWRLMVVGVLSFLFVVNAWYNFNVQFLHPVKEEYRLLRAYLEQQYWPEVKAVYFIRPEEDFFVRRYGVTRSWDEFGVPSTFFNWVPEFWVKQVVLEKTGDRQLAERLVVKHWLGRAAFQQSGEKLQEGVLLMDAEAILAPQAR